MITRNNKTMSVFGAATSISGNLKQFVEEVKRDSREAYVMERVVELQREGLWSQNRLPKVQENRRPITHWDFLLEEMVWMSIDFAHERKWKKDAAKKCARMIQKHFTEKALAVIKTEKAQEAQLRRIASFIAKEIRTFWANVQKIVEFKQKTRLEEKRKQALDQHLSYIVDQTEKYSQLLAEGMNKSGTVASSECTTPASSSRLLSPHHSDEEFRPNEDQSSSDDEETIAQAEAADEPDKQNEEIAALQRESQMDLEDFLNELPKDYLENRDKIILSESERDSDTASTSEEKKKDEDFKVENEESEDDEDTIREQEKAEGDVDHKQELDDLKAENEMSIEELMKMYMSLPPPEDSENSNQSGDAEEADSEAESSEEDAEESDDKASEESEVEVVNEEESEEKGEVGFKLLVEDSSTREEKGEGDSDEVINDVAALAESIQPTGNTLSSTCVVTAVPFLLKYPLREYQYVGLEWLVTMYERKKNGILADEMGLGKTIQTIALLAYLACEKGDWGPHLIIVPTSVMLNWEMECKKWCPGFKILTYYGTPKERKRKRIGWTKQYAFHICITSYTLVIQDHQSFRRKQWKYMILDEAQNIKNFKSQRWQLLLNFQTQRRLLLTGTPLQNNLMELWSLMHFLVPDVFESHREFKEWFSNPVTCMIEGNSGYNERTITRLHKVLRPFLLRRLKSEVEEQMPQKFEHITMCRLSKRQRFLYDDFMSRAKTRETLATGNLLSVINVLMQLRKVCNHPNLFEVRPTVSPFQCEGLVYLIPSLIYNAMEYDILKNVNLETLYLHLINMELQFSAYQAFRSCKLRAPKLLIETIDEAPTPPPPCPKGLVHMRVKLADPNPSVQTFRRPARQVRPVVGPKLIPGVKTAVPVQEGSKLRVAGPAGSRLKGCSIQIMSCPRGVKVMSLPTLSSTTIPALNTDIVGVKTIGDQPVAVPTGFAQLIYPLGIKHILLTPNTSLPQATIVSTTSPVMTSGGQRLTVLSKRVAGVPNTAATNQANEDVLLESRGQAARDILASGASLSRLLTTNLIQEIERSGMHPAHSAHTNSNTNYLFTPELKPKVSQGDIWRSIYNNRMTVSRQSKLTMLWRLNEWRCHASPMYGSDLREVVTMTSRCPNTSWTGGYLALNAAAATAVSSYNHTRTAFDNAVKNVDRRVEELEDIIKRFVFCVPAVTAKRIQYRVLNPSQSKYWREKRDEDMLMKELSPRATILHTIASAMCTQFPDTRLIQYDCGKLQILDLLLRRLKTQGHRVLIFTQMTRMLDVLEAFLNFHGHIYLRLDGTTKVEQRQVLIEKFNGNTKIFAFILSTRSGGVGVNLTGADTVIFYDSDWNPTMDAQAQDRCHRIGQTRDVHIYRLVSEKTVEENILKKANQKRMLGDLAIEGGNFTTAYFKSSTIQDLFDVDTNEDDANARMSEVLTAKSRKEPAASTSEPSTPPAPGDDRAAQSALENALAACEDDQDVQAAKTAKAEVVADLAEFDENIPLRETELQNIVNQLTPIERYAMRFIEAATAASFAEQLAAVERQIEEQKRVWEERSKAQAEDDENLITSENTSKDEESILTTEVSEYDEANSADSNEDIDESSSDEENSAVSESHMNVNQSENKSEVEDSKIGTNKLARAASSAEQLAAAERQIEERKRVWEERSKAQAEDDENLSTSDEESIVTTEISEYDEENIADSNEDLDESSSDEERSKAQAEDDENLITSENTSEDEESIVTTEISEYDEENIADSNEDLDESSSDEERSKAQAEDDENLITSENTSEDEESIVTTEISEYDEENIADSNEDLDESSSDEERSKAQAEDDENLITSENTSEDEESIVTTEISEYDEANSADSNGDIDESSSDEERSKAQAEDDENLITSENTSEDEESIVTTEISEYDEENIADSNEDLDESSSDEERSKAQPEDDENLITSENTSEDEESIVTTEISEYDEANSADSNGDIDESSSDEENSAVSVSHMNVNQSENKSEVEDSKIGTNKLDHNSTETRSGRTVKINLGTSDVSSVFPDVKPVRRRVPLLDTKNKILKINNRKSKILYKHNYKSKMEKALIEECLTTKVSVILYKHNYKSKMEKALIEECLTTKVSVVLTDVLKHPQVNSSESTSFKKSRESIKDQNKISDQKSNDGTKTKLPRKRQRTKSENDDPVNKKRKLNRKN